MELQTSLCSYLVTCRKAKWQGREEEKILWQDMHSPSIPLPSFLPPSPFCFIFLDRVSLSVLELPL